MGVEIQTRPTRHHHPAELLRLYEKLGGMTGTAMTPIRGVPPYLQLVVVPNPYDKPMVRADRQDLIYMTL